jgi:hypothetical protein
MKQHAVSDSDETMYGRRTDHRIDIAVCAFLAQTITCG